MGIQGEEGDLEEEEDKDEEEKEKEDISMDIVMTVLPHFGSIL